jgi:hypothetical protein
VRKTKLVLETGRATDRLTIRVVDEISRTAIAAITLDPTQVWDMIGGAYVEADAEITEHFDRVGKVMKVDSVIYSSADLKASTYDQQLEDAEAMARADRPGWDVYSAHRQGGGYGRVQVTLRRWE